jgi:hypothetical protein
VDLLLVTAVLIEYESRQRKQQRSNMILFKQHLKVITLAITIIVAVSASLFLSMWNANATENRATILNLKRQQIRKIDCEVHRLISQASAQSISQDAWINNLRALIKDINDPDVLSELAINAKLRGDRSTVQVARIELLFFEICLEKIATIPGIGGKNALSIIWVRTKADGYLATLLKAAEENQAAQTNEH